MTDCALYESRPGQSVHIDEHRQDRTSNYSPLVGSSRNRMEGLVTNSQAIETRLFSPPEIDRLPTKGCTKAMEGKLIQRGISESE